MKQAIIASLESIVGKKYVSVSLQDRTVHGNDRSFSEPVLPDIVVWPKTTEDVQKVAQLAYKHRIPLTPWGGGTSYMGNIIPFKKGIVVDLKRMNQLRKVSIHGMYAVTQPGIICDKLNEKLKSKKLFFPAIVGSSDIATIGGMAATNAGGMYALKYGVTKDWILELTVVASDGKLLHLGSKSRKTVSGYNLLSLFIGSFGTLGIITEITVRLAAIPENKMGALICFANLDDTTCMLEEILYDSIDPAAVELLDREYVSLVNKVQKDIPLSESDVIAVELHGKTEDLQRKMFVLEALSKRNNALSFQSFLTEKEVRRMWNCRNGIRPLLMTLNPNFAVISAEVGVPLSHVTSFMKEVQRLHKKYNISTPNHGHAGDGNFHAWVVYDKSDPRSLKKAHYVHDALVNYALHVGGTTTGEHGIGLSKKEFLRQEHPTLIRSMRDIKKIFDPKNILNPGKILPDDII